MSKPKKPANASQDPQPRYHVEGCTFTNTSAANEHTRAAVEALAAAAKANAEAIAAIASALKGSPATMECGLRVGP